MLSIPPQIFSSSKELGLGAATLYLAKHVKRIFQHAGVAITGHIRQDGSIQPTQRD
jgi:hypothetical protein